MTGGQRWLAVSCAWLLCCAVAHAQTRAARAPAQDRYEDLVREAVHEFAGGNFVEARTLFEQAHALRPSARTLRGLGSSAYELKRYTQAVRELEAALVDTRNPLTDAQRAEVQATLVKARRYVGTLALEAEPARATLVIDGLPVQAGVLMLDNGEHVVGASAPGYRSTERRITLAGEQELAVKLELEPLELSPAHVASASTTQSEASTSATGSAHDTDSGGLLSRWWFWTAAGVVVAGAAVGTALALSGGTTTAAADRGSGDVVLHPPH